MQILDVALRISDSETNHDMVTKQSNPGLLDPSARAISGPGPGAGAKPMWPPSSCATLPGCLGKEEVPRQ